MWAGGGGESEGRKGVNLVVSSGELGLKHSSRAVVVFRFQGCRNSSWMDVVLVGDTVNGCMTSKQKRTKNT